mmetsp:Transcript_48821/g.123857  ORF Transcript_48821/g.123857 Transcript_48821/m.123857 type:complete len:246 (+) Transcript_48821:76-813(+)
MAGSGGFLSWDDANSSMPSSTKRRRDSSASDLSASSSSSAGDGKKARGVAKAPAAAAAEPEEEIADEQETLASLAAAAGSPEGLSAPVLVRRFVASVLAEWGRLRAAGANASSEACAIAAAKPPLREALQPFIDLVEMRRPGDPDAVKVEKVCSHCLAGEHLAAEQVYLELTIGNVKWPIGGGSFLSSDGPQSGNRMWGQKTRSVEKTASILDDNAQRAAIQGLKRLVTFVHASGVLNVGASRAD